MSADLSAGASRDPEGDPSLSARVAGPEPTSRFQRVVLAIAETLVHHHGGGGTVQTAAVASFLIGTHARIPDYLRLPLMVLTLAFDAWGVPTAGRPFHRLPLQARAKQIETWRRSRIGPRRDLIKFFETLAIFGIYSDKYPEDYLAGPAPAEW
jgi:hypothetical protein